MMRFRIEGIALVAFFLMFLPSTGALAQIDLPFPIVNPMNPGQNLPQSFDLGDPTNLQQGIVYDPETGKYIFTETIGNGLFYHYPSMMSIEDYLEYQEKKSQTLDWQEIIEEETAENGQFELPIKIGSKLFENFFGSDEIKIIPGGNIEISLGANHSRIDNPMLPLRQRNITRFDFNQNINLDVTGQIGTKLKLTMRYNTGAQFDFNNFSNIQHSGREDEILQEIALGNVQLNLPTTLIQGSQTLFGVKTQMKFGRSTWDLIAAQSKGKRTEINVSGKAQIQEFQLSADNYDQNRHYFLNLYHQQHYDAAMASLPIVNSTAYITRIEVWITNRNSSTENTRNVLAFADLGEALPTNCQGSPGSYSTTSVLPDNESNGLYAWASNQPLIRGFANSVSTLSAQVTSPGPFQQAIHYEKVENARKLADNEFTYNALLGYISLNSSYNNDEVIAVAYEYTYNGQIFQVGEFSTDGSSGQDALLLKMLKPTITIPNNKVWDLMMKNVYSINAAQVDQTGFKVDILYNNPDQSVLIPFMPYEGVNSIQTVTLLEMDKLNQNSQPFSDGVFDFVPMNQVGNKIDNGGTINRKTGRIYFSTIEPFGATLKNKLNLAGLPPSAVDKISFLELYDSTKTAAQQIPSKNRFTLKGQFQSSISSEISLGAFDIPEGAVAVTAGGIKLTEGVDYQVDYAQGRVKILNTSLLESNTQIKVSIESNSMFGFQARTLIGGHYTYRFSQNLNLGATWVRMTERPITQKVDFGSEPFKNNVIGADFSWRTNVPFLTKLVDLLPVISTNQMSTFAIQGEVATLIPGQPRAINKEGTSYLDDFEAAQSAIDLRASTAWRLASIPQGQPDLFPEASNLNLGLGYNRSKLAWYSIDPVFMQNNNLTPQHISQNAQMLADARMRLLLITELFPNNQPQQGQMTNVATLDLAYYPNERGMYNYDTTGVDSAGNFINPESHWGGISRALATNDFETANIEFIQFWMLDPFNEDAENVNPNALHNGGDLYFNLGNISEDVLPDSRKSFENGLPASTTVSQENIDTTVWSRVSSQQIVVNAFDNDPEARISQDVGLDGWRNDDERLIYSAYVNWVTNNPNLTAQAKARMISDPSSDDYTYYLDDNYDNQTKNILERYKQFNGMEGNSPTTQMSDTANAQGYPTQATNFPDNEDINTDNNLSESENYFQYRVRLRPNEMVEGKNYITNVQEIPVGNKTERWYQFKVPIIDFERKINGIQDFRSIRFMRMFLKNFDEEVVLRFARLELIRGEWRRYNLDLTQPGLSIQVDPNLTTFNIGAVNVEENSEREPIKYVVPPGIVREIDPSQVFQRQMNEQSLVLDICNLRDGDARAAYRNVNYDVRTYKKMKMFVHAENIAEFQNQLQSNDLTLFVRLGTDFVENYYEYELPLKVTDPSNASTPEQIWPEDNNVEIVFSDLINLKKDRNSKIESGTPGVSYIIEYESLDPQNVARKIKVRGSPNLQGMKTIMVGVRNPLQSDPDNIWKPDNGEAECVNVWINELRLTDFVSEGGSAAVGQVQLQLADFANIAASGNYSGINWGSVESRVQERQRNERLGLDLNSTVQLGQFFGKKTRISLPFFYGYSVGIINPEFDPFNPDVKLIDYDPATRRERAKLGQDFSERKSYNFSNVRKEIKAGAKPHFWRVSNWSATYAYSELLKRDFNTRYDITKTWNGSLNYNYTFAVKPWEPLKKWKPVQKNKNLQLVKDLNIFLLPKNMSFTNEFARIYNERQIRNNIVPDYEFAPVYLKKYDWVRTYNIGYDLSKSIKATFSAVNKSIFEEGNHGIDRRTNPNGYREFMDTLRSQVNTLGKTMDYTQNYSLSYNIPFDKIPLTNWLTANAKYTGSFNWQRAPFGQSEFGNTIQNNRNLNFTAQANFLTLYNKSALLKKVLTGGNSGGRANLNFRDGNGDQKNKEGKNNEGDKAQEEFKPDKPLEEMTPKERKQFERKKKRWERKKAREKKRKENAKKKVNPVVGAACRLLMTVRNISGTYALNDGTLLPGFNQESRILGMNNSTTGLTGFVFGKQGYDLLGRRTGYNVAEQATENNWLAQNQNLNKQYSVTHSENLSLKATLEPFKDFNINLNLLRNYSINESEFYRWNNSSSAFESQNNFKTAQLTYTTLTMPSAFQKLDREYSSQTFQTLLNNLQTVSQFLGQENSNSVLLPNQYYDGYSGSQQDVVIGAFLSAYTNSTVNQRSINPVKNIPMPNWTLNYNGLTKFEFTKKFLKNFKLNHAYSSTIAVSGMQTNLNAQLDINGNASSRDINNNFISELQVQNVVVNEKFAPLVGFLATWNIFGKSLTTNFEYKKERQSTLSLNNNQITENLSTTMVVGTVLTFPKLKLPFDGIKQSDLIVNVNFNFQDNIVVVRKIVEEFNQATSGQKIVSFKLDANYKLTDFILASFYYEQRITTPKIQTSFPTGNLKTGITIRYDLNGLK